MSKTSTQNLAPIVVFAFNRLDPLKKTVASLLQNEEAKDSDLYVFVDGARPNKAGEDVKVKAVQEYVKSIKGFKKIEYFFSEKNKGLADSIISGTTKIINLYNKVIVVEDDLYVSAGFLEFMNYMLNKYEHDERIFQVSGYGVKINLPKDYAYDYYMHIRAHSWTWGTWKDRWETVDWQVGDFQSLCKDKKKQRAFNRGGSDLFGMLKGYMTRKNNSWYIRFTYSMFCQGRYAVMPVRSLVRNDGFGGEATHCNTYNRYKVDFNEKGYGNWSEPAKMEFDKRIGREASKYWSIRYRIYGKIRTLLMKL